MLVSRAHSIAVYPTDDQKVILRKSCGVSRYAYNWALSTYKAQYEEYKKARGINPEQVVVKAPKISELKKRWNTEKPEWVYETPKDANQQPFTNLQTALTNFFRDAKKPGGSRKAGFPKYKKRGDADSFYCSNDKVQVKLGTNIFRLPVIGWIRGAEHFKPLSKKSLHINSVVVSRKADQWYMSVSYSCSIEDPVIDAAKPVACIDLGLRTFATVLTSDGVLEEIQAPQPLKSAFKKLKRYQRKIARCAGSTTDLRNKRHEKKGRKIRKYVRAAVKKSTEERRVLKASKKQAAENPGQRVLYVAPEHKNREKALKKVAKLHQRVFNTRKDFIEKLSTRLLSENQAVVLEDLSITGMQASRKWARKVGDLGLRTFRTRLEVKAPVMGSRVLVLDRWYPSSKTCSVCGHVHKALGLEKLWECPQCGTPHDRDVNAVQNMLQDVGLPYLAAMRRGSGVLPGLPESLIGPKKTDGEHARAGMPAEALLQGGNTLLSSARPTKQSKTSRGRRPLKESVHLCALSL